MSRKGSQPEAQTKIGGWDGRFVVEKPVLPQGYKVVESTRGALAHEQWQEPTVCHKTTQHSRQETSRNSSTATQQQHHQYQQQQQQQQQVQYTNQNSNQYNVPISYNDPREHYVKIERAHDEHSGSIRTNSNCVNQSTTILNGNSQRVLPHQTYQNGQQIVPVNAPVQNLPTSNYIPYGNSSYVPYGSKSHASETTSQTVRNVATGNQFHSDSYATEPEILPPRWDGTFPSNYLQGRPKGNQNSSNTNSFYGFAREPEILPTTWDGTFGKSGETCMLPDRNRSATNDFYGYNSEPTILPTTWNGEFQLDPNDVRIKPERNVSDVRDYADHRNFHLRSQ